MQDLNEIKNRRLNKFKYDEDSLLDEITNSGQINLQN